MGAPFSVSVDVTDDDDGPGAIPGISLAVKDGPVVEVGWLPPDPGTSPITGYVVEYAGNAAFGPARRSTPGLTRSRCRLPDSTPARNTTSASGP